MFHYNPSISEDTHRILNLKSGDSNNQVSENIQPIIEIKPKINIIRDAGGGSTIYTTPTDKDFYLTNATLSTFHLATDTGTDAFISLIVDGVSVKVCYIKEGNNPGLNSSQTVSLYFNPPIKVDRGTIINSSNSNFTSGRGSIQGYTRETLKGV